MSGENGVVVDSDFECASAGEIRLREDGVFEIDYLHENVVDWFQELIDGGVGVPKEYAFCVRARNTTQEPQRVTCRFLLSPVGREYLAPQEWIRRADGWEWIPAADVLVEDDRSAIEVSAELGPSETAWIGSAPFIDPGTVQRRAQALADEFEMWTYREIGRTAQDRPIVTLESPDKPLKAVIAATAQAAEPVAWGILHVAHWLTIPTARARRLLEHVQFVLMPMTNPDGAAEGRSLTNALGEVPKFSWQLAEEGKNAPAEARAWLEYLATLRPDVFMEIHAHFRWEHMWRTIGTDVVESVPGEMQDKSGAIEQALRTAFPDSLPENGMSMIDTRIPDHRVYGTQVLHRLGILGGFLQAIPTSIESHGADVQEVAETLAEALIGYSHDTA